MASKHYYAASVRGVIMPERFRGVKHALKSYPEANVYFISVSGTSQSSMMVHPKRGETYTYNISAFIAAKNKGASMSGMSGFMEPQVIYGDWIYIDTNYGSYYLPEDLFDLKTVVQMKKDAKKGIDMHKKYYSIVRDYIDGTEIYDLDVLTGWGARLSAPGYMDATEWSAVFETAAEAEEFLEETYGLDDDYEG